ncbi:hypothetical protein T484DRAFT_1865846, partial [Baffinella frigidus]
MSVSQDQPLVATGGKDGQIRVWDVRQRACALEIATQGEEVLSLHLNPSETMLAGGFTDAT